MWPVSTISEHSGVRYGYKWEQHNIFYLFIWIYFRNPNINNLTNYCILFTFYKSAVIWFFSCDFLLLFFHLKYYAEVLTRNNNLCMTEVGTAKQFTRPASANWQVMTVLQPRNGKLFRKRQALWIRLIHTKTHYVVKQQLTF